MNLADRFKILRILNGYTQTELARKARLPQSSVANWEKGKYGPGGDVGISLASILGVHPGYLFQGKPIISSAVWFPMPPKREQHLQVMIKDIYELLPSFLTENNLMAYTTAILEDGQAYLFGDSSDQPTFSCLAVVNNRLVEYFLKIFSDLNLWSPVMYKHSDLTKYTVSTFNADALDSWGNLRVNEDENYNRKKIGDNLSRIKMKPLINIADDLAKDLRSYLNNRGIGLEEIVIKKDQLTIILQTVHGSVSDGLTDKNIQELSSLIIRKCEESMEIPHKPISKQSILEEVSEILGRS